MRKRRYRSTTIFYVRATHENCLQRPTCVPQDFEFLNGLVPPRVFGTSPTIYVITIRQGPRRDRPVGVWLPPIEYRRAISSLLTIKCQRLGANFTMALKLLRNRFKLIHPSDLSEIILGGMKGLEYAEPTESDCRVAARIYVESHLEQCLAEMPPYHTGYLDSYKTVAAMVEDKARATQSEAMNVMCAWGGTRDWLLAT